MTMEKGAKSGVCYIVGAAKVRSLAISPDKGDLIIAADGGWLTLKQYGITPDIVIGDFDSSPVPSGAEVLKLNPIKDITDTMRAADYGRELGFRRFKIYGCIGGRTAHTIANIQMMSSLVKCGCECTLYGDGEIMTAISNGSISFSERSKGFVSVFSLDNESHGVCESGLKYTLDNYTLSSVYPTGVSNEFTGKPAKISVTGGTLLVIYTDNAQVE